MRTLFVLNDPPHATERCYNALRLAHALLQNDPDAEVTVFLMADSVVAALRGQKTPGGGSSMERLLKRVIVGEGMVLVSGPCMDTHALAEEDMIHGARRATMEELAAATMAADKVLVF